VALRLERRAALCVKATLGVLAFLARPHAATVSEVHWLTSNLVHLLVAVVDEVYVRLVIFHCAGDRCSEATLLELLAEADVTVRALLRIVTAACRERPALVLHASTNALARRIVGRGRERSLAVSSLHVLQFRAVVESCPNVELAVAEGHVSVRALELAARPEVDVYAAVPALHADIRAAEAGRHGLRLLRADRPRRTGRNIVRPRVDVRRLHLRLLGRRRAQRLETLRETQNVLDLGLSRVEGWSVCHCPLSRVSLNHLKDDCVGIARSIVQR